MKTDELIVLLAADAGVVSPRVVARRLGLGVVAGCVAALVVLLAWLGVRPDLMAAMHSGPFWMKAAYTLAVSAGALALSERLARPGARLGAGPYVLAGALATIVGLGLIDAAAAPSADRMTLMMGHSWRLCGARIVVMAAPVFAGAVWALRRLAPTRLRLAGAGAGLLAGGMGATLYGLYCQETAAAFVAVWYTLGLGACAGLGALVGPRLLRW